MPNVPVHRFVPLDQLDWEVPTTPENNNLNSSATPENNLNSTATA